MQHRAVTESEVDATTHTSTRFRDAIRRFRVSHMLHHFHVNNQKVRADVQADKLSLRRLKSGVIAKASPEDHRVCNPNQVSTNFCSISPEKFARKCPSFFYQRPRHPTSIQSGVSFLDTNAG